MQQRVTSGDLNMTQHVMRSFSLYMGYPPNQLSSLAPQSTFKSKEYVIDQLEFPWTKIPFFQLFISPSLFIFYG